MCFPKNMSKKIGKNISAKLSGKYSQKHFDHPKQSATDSYFKKSNLKNSRSS